MFPCFYPPEWHLIDSVMIDKYYYDGVIAEWYDDWLSQRRDDVDTYTSLFSGFRERVLELACGTGRLLLPIAGSGTIIDGLDSSADMLKKLGNKADALGLASTQTFNQSMVKFSLPHKYDAVFIGGGSFQLLISNEDVKSCLECVSQHLNDTGFFALDVFIPRDAINNGGADVFKVTRDVTRADGTRSVVSEKTEVDLAGQIQRSAYRYDFYRGGVLAQSFDNSFELRWYGVEQMINLLKAAGFTSVEMLSGLPLCQPDTSYVLKASKTLSR
jgi:SAM-dependent methyltransferase